MHYNIFKDFIKTKNEIMDNKECLYSEKHVKLIDLIDSYFRSGLWAKSDTESLIYRHIMTNVSSNKTAEYLKVNPNTIRSKVSRINTRLLNNLFDGKYLSDVCLSLDNEIISNTINRISYLLNCPDFYGDISYSFDSLMNKIPYTESSDYSETDLFNALAFLAMHSKSVIEFQLKGLNSNALDSAIEILTKMNYQKEMSYFQHLQSNYKKAFNMKDETIRKIKESCEK